MKKIIFLFVAIASLTSCSITKRHYAPGYHVQLKSCRSHDLTLNEHNENYLHNVIHSKKDLTLSPSLILQDVFACAGNDGVELNSSVPSHAPIQGNYSKVDESNPIGDLVNDGDELETESQTSDLSFIEITSDTVVDPVQEKVDISVNDKVNRLAIVGFILSIIGIPGFILSILGGLLCWIALDEIKNNGGRGKRLAKIGMFVPIVWAGALVLYVIGFIILYAIDAGIS